MTGDAQQKPEALQHSLDKMESAGLPSAQRAIFEHYFTALAAGESGLLPESQIEPLTDVAELGELTVTHEQAREVLDATVVVKLNGGLGTSMGMTKAKSLLDVQPGVTFLDIIARQIIAARDEYSARLPLVFMNSFSTHDDTLTALSAHQALQDQDLPAAFLQSQEPKLLADSLEPATWPADPALEWCPPGHGDIYPSLLSSGILDAALEAGYRYIFVSNSDNVGASPDPRIAAWFANTDAPFAMEVCRRTEMDRKGGHVTLRKSDGQVVLREAVQTPEADVDAFQDFTRHRWFNTNSLWLDAQALKDKLTETGGVLGLPLLRNVKTVDPKDPSSPKVIQMETAMGTAIGVFDGATVIGVPRARFLPVKTTNELMLLRSDVYELDDFGCVTATVSPTPVVKLSSEFKKIADFEARTPHGVPSLREASSFTVDGDVTFGANVIVKGDVKVVSSGETTTVDDGAVLDG